jgi:cell division protein ZapA
MSNALDVKLLDKDYRVACDPAERESLLAAVAFLDGRLSDIAAKTKSKGERLAMMAALNLAHELLALKNIPPSEAAALESETVLATINAIESKVDAALADHGHPA